MNRTRKHIALVALIMLLLTVASSPAFACATCFGAADDKQTHGMNAAIITMLVVTYTLFSGIALAAFLLWRKALKTSQEGFDEELSLQLEGLDSHG